MSLLMEALRKAEEAKSKAELGDKEQPLEEPQDTEEENTSNSLETIRFEAAPKPKDENEDSLDDLEYLSDDDGPSLIDAKTDEINQLENIESEPSPADELIEALPKEIEHGELPEHQKPTQEHSPYLEEEYSQRNNPEIDDKQAINALFQAKIATQQQRKRKYSIAATSIILLLGVTSGTYWYFGIGSKDNQYNIPAPSQATERTFLGEQIALEENAADSELSSLITPIDESVSLSEDSEPSNEINASLSSQEQVTSLAAIATQESSRTDLVNSEQSPEAEPAPERASINFRRTTVQNELNPLLNTAYSNFQTGNFDEAFDQYQTALNSEQTDREAMLGLASIYIKREEPLLARSMYSRILRLNPKDPIAQAGLLGTSLSNDLVSQESDLKSLIDLHPNVAPLSFALGNLYASQNRWNEAQSAYFDASISAKRSTSGLISPDYAFNLAVSLERLNQPSLAYTYYQEALELSRSSTSGFKQESLLSRIQHLEQELL